MSDQEPAAQMWAEAGLSTSAKARRLEDELATVRGSAERAFRAVEELSQELAASVVALHKAEGELKLLRPVVATAVAWRRRGGPVDDRDLLMDEVGEYLAERKRRKEAGDA